VEKQPLSIIVVGGGIYGVTAAIELRRRGQAVSLFDPGPLPHPDASSTDISKAIRMDYGSDEFYMELMEVALERWDTWNREWGEALYHETGILFMARKEMQAGDYEYESYALLQKRGHPPQRLNSKTLRERFPAWAADQYPDGYYNPRAGWAESGKVVSRLIEQAKREGVSLREGVSFDRLLEDGSRVTGIITSDGERHRADSVVVAAGAWTPTLLPHLSDAMWATGQPVLHFKPKNRSLYQASRFPVWGADISNTGWYGFPIKEDGTLKVANHGPGKRVHPGEPRVVDAHEEERFRAFFRETFPDLVDAEWIGSRLCLYCDTWDGNFWIDHDPQREGLVVASGGSGHGFKFGPVFGEIIADVLERKPNRFAHRFAWRMPRELKTEDARFAGER
jgi:glycine/D-amino acid oxidase-like deaminating enzyme